jgi:GNAT superfamily N-acetyltransferase
MTPSVHIRPGRPEDAQACARICYDAFCGIANEHGFPPDFPSPEIPRWLMGMLFSHAGFYSLVAELDGHIVGSNFLDERSVVAGLGPISVDPSVQNQRIGRRLMHAALDRVVERRFPGVRLVQTAYHSRSLALYAELGFHVREPLACMQGPPLDLSVPDYHVRAGTIADLHDCDRVCLQVHGLHRHDDVRDAIEHGSARVVEHHGRITGYATNLAFSAHAVGETQHEIMALVGGATEFGGPGILVPMRDHALFSWCLAHGLRVVQVMTLMTIGLYNEPKGSYLPSILY